MTELLKKYSGFAGIVIGSVLLSLSWLSYPSDQQLFYLSQLGLEAESRLYFSATLLIGAFTSYYFFIYYVVQKYDLSPRFTRLIKVVIIAQIVAALLQADTSKPLQNIAHWSAAITLFLGLFFIIWELSRSSNKKSDAAIWKAAKIYLSIYIVLNAYLLLQEVPIVTLQLLTLALFWVWMIYLTFGNRDGVTTPDTGP